MTTMFVQLRRVVYLLVLLQCCTCVAYAEESSSNRVKEAEQFLKNWVNKSEGYLAEGKAYQEVWGTTVESCNSRANAAWDVDEGTKKLIKKIITVRGKPEEYQKNYPVPQEIRDLLRDATGKIQTNVSVLNKAADAVEEARKLFRMSALAMINMRDMLENKNDSRNQSTEVLEGVDEGKRSVEQEALIKRSKRVYKEMNEVYHKLLVIKRRSHACAKEVSNGVIATKNRIIRALELFDNVGGQFKPDYEGYGKEVNEFYKLLQETLEGELVYSEYYNTRGVKSSVLIVGRTSASAIAGAAFPNTTKKRKINTTKLAEKVEAAKKKEKENLESKKREEEKELRNLHEERQRERERKKAEEEAKKAAEERRMEQERNKAEEEKKKIKEDEAKQELEKKTKEEKEKKKKKKDGSSSPALMHSPFLFFVLMCVLGCTVVC